MSQKAEKPPDPAHEAKLAARREKHAVKVWSANPRTKELQRKYDEALRQLQQLQLLGEAGEELVAAGLR